jgi:hypothetical protein
MTFNDSPPPADNSRLLLKVFVLPMCLSVWRRTSSGEREVNSSIVIRARMRDTEEFGSGSAGSRPAVPHFSYFRNRLLNF